MHLSPFLTLLRHQLRLLAQNRSACLVLLMLAVLAVFAQRIEQPRRPVCYILYWQEDAWIKQLKDQLPPPAQRLGIEVASAQRFTNEHGMIEYPSGAHSIQLRPPTRDRDYWVIWFWYSGARADVLNPVADWFWSATQAHLDDSRRMHVRVSSLRPRSAVFDIVPPAVQSCFAGGQWKGLIVWVAVFFCGCYLPAMALAQQRENRTLYSLVSTPVGWAGVGLSTSTFYFALTVVVSLSVAIALGYQADLGLWATILLASAIYVAIGLTLGCWCDGAASASAGMLVYLVLAGGFALMARTATGLPPWVTSVELGVTQTLHQPAGGEVNAPWALAMWLPCWLLAARQSFRRLKLQH